MKKPALHFLAWLTVILPLAAQTNTPARLALVSDREPQRLFAGDAQRITCVWRNASDQALRADVHMKLWQTSSATAVRLGDTPWKILQLLPRQTVLESAALDFPAVKGRTKFLVQWCENTNDVLGATEVLVYPTNLLQELKLLVNDDVKLPGVLDPRDQLKPVLKNAAVKFADLADMKLDDFSGPLAVIGPCGPDTPEWNGLADRISRLAARGTAVVWIQSTPPKTGPIQPSFYLVPKGRAVVVVVDPALVADLADQPQAQLNLIYFCKLALSPEPFRLPDLTIQ